MYTRWRRAVQNICSDKITKLANMWEEMDVFVTNWKGSISQSAAIATFKTSYNGLHLCLLTAYEVSWNFFQYFRTYGQNDIPSVFTLAVVTSYYLHLHIQMAASISQVSEL